MSFWIPGFFGSLAAAPQQPGWSLANIYYHTSISAGSDVALSREITLGKIPANLTANANLNVSGTGDLGFVIPTYVFATPVLGAQMSASLAGAYGVASSNLGGSISGTLATPFGNECLGHVRHRAGGTYASPPAYPDDQKIGVPHVFDR